MDAHPDLSEVAKAIGDPTRVRMLAQLMGGRAATAKELAYDAGVTPATATAHLRRLRRSALVEVRSQGRHKYFRLASPDVARCVEALMVIAPPPAVSSRTPERLREARFCYDHLAGRLGTAFLAALLKRRHLRATRDGFEVTPRGEEELAKLGVDVTAARTQRRKLAPACLDWSERRDHLGGALGAALAEALLAQRWIRRRPGTREVDVTPLGRQMLVKRFGITLDEAD